MRHHNRDSDNDFDWVNAWAAQSKPDAVAPAPGAAARSIPPSDQLRRDIAEIERARDALAALPLQHRTRALTLVPSRTTDAVPVMIGGVLALVMLTIFGAAAAMSKLTR